MDKPLLSVIMPTYNREKYIVETIESVFAQNYQPMELIVVDDGSTDNSSQILKSYQDRIIYLYKENGGIASARNAGLKVAKGSFIAFIDSDDIWAPSKLSRQFSLFNENPSLEIAVGFSTKFENDVSKLKEDKGTFELSLVSALIKSSVFKEIGNFDEDLKLGEDTDWFLRAREIGTSIAIHDDLVAFFRRHSDNITNDLSLRNYYIFKVLKKVKDRNKRSEKSTATNTLKPENVEDLISLWNTADLT